MSCNFMVVEINFNLTVSIPTTMQNALELLEDMDDENQRLLSYLIALTLLDDEDFDFIQFELV